MSSCKLIIRPIRGVCPLRAAMERVPFKQPFYRTKRGTDGQIENSIHVPLLSLSLSFSFSLSLYLSLTLSICVSVCLYEMCISLTSVQVCLYVCVCVCVCLCMRNHSAVAGTTHTRSEERCGGKVCRSRWSPYHLKKITEL